MKYLVRFLKTILSTENIPGSIPSGYFLHFYFALSKSRCREVSMGCAHPIISPYLSGASKIYIMRKPGEKSTTSAYHEIFLAKLCSLADLNLADFG